MNEDTPTYEVGPDEAFAAARAGLELFDKPLRNFSRSRERASLRLGCTASALSEAARESLRTTGLYPAALDDTVIVLWLCTLRDQSELAAVDHRAGEWSPERARMLPAQALEAADAWADGVGLTSLKTEQFFEAYKLFMQIVFAIDASVFEVEVDKDNSPALGQTAPKAKPANPKTRTSSRA